MFEYTLDELIDLYNKEDIETRGSLNEFIEKLNNSTDPKKVKGDTKKDTKVDPKNTVSSSVNGSSEQPENYRYIEFKGGTIVYEDDYLKNFAGTKNYPQTFDGYAKAFGTEPKSFKANEVDITADKYLDDSYELEEYNKIRSSFGYKPLSPNQYKEELDREVTIKEEEDITNYLEELTPGSKYSSEISDEVTKIYNKRINLAPKTEFDTIDFDNEEVTSKLYKDIISDFQNENTVIQNEILPRITEDVEEKTRIYVNKLKLEMGLDNPKNVNQESIDELKSKANDFYNKNINTELAKDKEFKAVNNAFNNKIEEIQGPSYKRFIKGKDSPNMLKFQDLTSTTSSPKVATLALIVENSYNSIRGIENSLEDYTAKAWLGYQVEKEKHLEDLQKRVDQYNADDNIEGVWITDKQNPVGSWKFIPKQGLGWEGERRWRTLVAGNEYKEGTFADFKKAFGDVNNDDTYIGKEYKKIGERLSKVQEKTLIISQWDENEFDKIMKGEDIVSNAIGLAAEQLPQMALSFVTLGASSGLQIGSDIYAQGIDVEARKRFNLAEGETPSIAQLADVLKDEEFMSSLETKAVTGGFIAGQLERFGAGKTLKAFTFAGAKSILRGGYKSFLKKVANGTVANTQNSLTESITEVLQEIIQSGATGANIDGQQLFEAGGTGFISSLTMGVAGNVKNQSAQEIKTISKIISGKLNPNSSEAFLNSKLKSLDISFKNEEISENAYKESVEAIKSVRDANASIPKNFSKPSKEKALDLLIQKQELLSEIEGKDASLVKVEREMIAEINTELESLAVLEKAIGKRQTLLEAAQKAGVVENLSTKSFDSKEELKSYVIEQGKGEARAKMSMGQYGTIFQNPKTGKQEILINKEIALEDGVITTADHEFLHAVLFQTVKDNRQAQINLGQALYTELLKQTGGAIKNTELAQRLNGYLERSKNPEEQADAWEEALTLFAEGLGDGTFKENTSFVQKIKDLLQKIFGKEISKEIRFDTGADVVNFIKEYNKSFESGKWGENIKKAAKEGVKGSLVGEKTKKPTVGTDSKASASSDSLSDLIQQRDELDMFDFDDPNEFDSALANIERKIKIAEKKNKETKIKPATEKPKSLVNEKQIGDQFKEMVPQGTTNTEYKENIAPKVIRDIEDKRMLFPLVKKIAAGYGIVADNVYGKDWNEFYDAVVGVQMKKNIMNFKPESNNDLGGYIIGSQAGIRNRVKEALSEFKKEKAKTSEDIDQARDLTAEETTTFTKDTRKKYTSISNSNVVPNFTVTAIKDKLTDILSKLKSKITDKAGDNAASTPLVKEIRKNVGKVVGDKEAIPKLIRQRMGAFTKDRDTYKSFLIKNKRAILENMTTTWLSTAIPIAVEKSVGGSYTGNFETVNIAGIESKYEIFNPNYVPYSEWKDAKIDREGGAKRGITSGNELTRRVPVSKISDQEFVDALIFKGDNKKTQTKFESLSKALAEELSFEIISKELKNPNSEISLAFEANQQALGVMIQDNIAQEFSRQAERGLVKFSMKIDKEQAKLITKSLVKEGIFSKEAKRLALEKGLTTEQYNKLLDNTIHEGIVAYMQDLEASNKGFKYEKALNSVLNKFTDKKIKVNTIENIKGDINIQIGSAIYSVEIKLNEKAQVGSASIGLFDINDKGVILLKNAKELKLSKELSENNLELFNSFLNKPSTVKYLENLTKAVNEANSKSKEFKATITSSGHLKLPYKDFWDNIKDEMPNKIAGYISYKADQSIIEDFYKDIDLIQVGDYGAYAIGENSKLNGYYAKLEAETNNVLRPVRSNLTVYTRLFSNFEKIISEKENSLDTSEGIKKLANIAIDDSNFKDVETGQEAINNATKNSYANNPKGISVWDFDDTLAKTKSNVLYTMPDGTKGKLDAAEFAARSESLADIGAEFDFSEFSKVMKGEKGPMFDKAIARNKKFGNENVYVLTARPADSKFAIHKFLKGIGLDIKLDNIVGLADGNPQAKANWMIGKVAEGYNDFYFADDHIGNVKAVKEVLDTFDVKGKVQQAKVKFSASLDKNFNDIIQRNKGVLSEKEYSKVAANRLGARKGRFKIWMPSSLDDFKGLTMYAFSGKGEQGESDQKFFQDALITPYFRGINAIYQKKQALKDDFKKLNKMYRPVLKKLGKLIPNLEYTHDQAIRVYLWNKSGYEIPGLDIKDKNKLIDFISNNAELLQYAQMLQRIAKRKKWTKPSTHWDVETILSDLNNITEKVGRKEYLSEFIENVDIVFSEKNLNKVEALYRRSHREALEDIIYRMKNGTNRPSGSNKNVNRFNTWVNNSIGAIMFFNRRSALLQTLSTVNFINWSDNNMLKAGLAFANQPQFWKDFAMIFNSAKLKQRRSGLRSDVNEAEIASAVKGSKNKALAALSYLLKIGFTPTQMVDSFAIASGGASFYRNRLNTYLSKLDSDGEKLYTQKQAEEKAFEDFSVIAEETQQSGDPALISSDQASALGRLLLAFQNTPIQLNRSIKKAALDIYNRRRTPGLTMIQSDFSNLSKIIYYGSIQNLIFSALQNALFALIPGFEDEDDELTEKEQEEKYGKVISTKQNRIINGISDTILKGGFGVPGAFISTIKNVVLEKKKQEEKGYMADNAYVILQAANLAPSVGSKLRKIYSGMQTEKFEKDAIEARGWDVTIDGKFNLSPKYRVLGSYVEGATNFPLERMTSEVESLTEALDARNTAWQRIALTLGWRTWDVGAKNEENELIKLKAKTKRKEEGVDKAKVSRKSINDAKKAYEKSLKQVLYKKARIKTLANNFKGEKLSSLTKDIEDTIRKEYKKQDSIKEIMFKKDYKLEGNKFVKTK